MAKVEGRTFKVGDKIRHNALGLGEIIGVRNADILLANKCTTIGWEFKRSGVVWDLFGPAIDVALKKGLTHGWWIGQRELVELVERATEPGWKQFVNAIPGECPCGRPREGCPYHG